MLELLYQLLNWIFLLQVNTSEFSAFKLLNHKDFTINLKSYCINETSLYCVTVWKKNLFDVTNIPKYVKYLRFLKFFSLLSCWLCIRHNFIFKIWYCSLKSCLIYGWKFIWWLKKYEDDFKSSKSVTIRKLKHHQILFFFSIFFLSAWKSGLWYCGFWNVIFS